MRLSVVIPLFNEEKNIPSLVSFLRGSNPLEKEVFFIDGGSTDKTVELIKDYGHGLNYQIVHNKRKTVPYGLNLAIPKCKGEVIARLDGHTRYDSDYFQRILDRFDAGEADIVGGPMRIEKGTWFQGLVGKATSASIGVGNSSFHFENFEGEADSVYLGAWKKEIFSNTGLFDTSLKRNQDDEFHYRAKSKGYRIYQDPKVRSWYNPRKNFRGLTKQYFEYGLYKPLVLKKVKSGLKVRHLVPSLFVLYLLLIPSLFWVSKWIVLPLMLYAVLILFQSMKDRIALFRIPVYFMIILGIHLSYGIGFLLGLFKLFRK